MTLLSRDAIFEADDRPTEDVEVPEWGGSVRLRCLSGRERDKFEASMVKMKKGGKQEDNFENLRARLVALCIVDENNVRLFQSSGDVIKLGEKSAAALSRVFEAAQKLNGMTSADVEELTEDFEEAPDESFDSA